MESEKERYKTNLKMLEAITSDKKDESELLQAEAKTARQKTMREKVYQSSIDYMSRTLSKHEVFKFMEMAPEVK